jgi:hypothetical protein
MSSTLGISRLPKAHCPWREKAISWASVAPLSGVRASGKRSGSI